MEYLAEGQLLSKAIEATQQRLGAVFPAEFAARNLAHLINFPLGAGGALNGTALTCENFITPAIVPDQTQRNTICENFKFNNLETIRLFVNGTWFGTNDFTNVMA